MRKIVRNQRGITLVALVITIIILIILAGISLSVLWGEEGLIAKAKQGGSDYKTAANDEQEALNNLDKQIVGITTANADGTIPEGYIKPEGTKQITANGEYNISGYEKVNVNVNNNGVMSFLDSNTNGFTATKGEANFKSYGMEAKTFSDTTEEEWHVIKYEKEMNESYDSQFEISALIFGNNTATSYMEEIEIILYKEGNVQARLGVGDHWNLDLKNIISAKIGENSIASSQNYNQIINNRYSIVCDGSKIYLYHGNTSLGNIDYSDGLEFDKVEIRFKKYDTYPVMGLQLQELYIGAPLYCKSFIN